MTQPSPQMLEALGALGTMAAALRNLGPQEYPPVDAVSSGQLEEQLLDLIGALETCAGALTHMASTVANYHQRGTANSPAEELAAAIHGLSGSDLQRLRRAATGVGADIGRHMPLLSLLAVAIHPQNWRPRAEMAATA